MPAAKIEFVSDYSGNKQLRDSFFRFVPKTFVGSDFRKWYDMGCWNYRYIPFSLIQEDRIIANASISQMEILIEGRTYKGIQLGTVGTLPEFRKRGMSRYLLENIIHHFEPSTDLFFLFANEDVTGFYPKFGFRRVEETIFSADVTDYPTQFKVRKLNIGDREDFNLLRRLAERRVPLTTKFGGRDYGHIFLWHAVSLRSEQLFCVDGEDVIVVGETEGDVLKIYDILSERPIDFPRILPKIRRSWVRSVDFYFTPDQLEIDARPSHSYSVSPLFVRGNFPIVGDPFKFPVLGQT